MKEKKFEFISDLTESRLIPSRNHLRSMGAKDVADLTMLYFITLQIMKSEYLLRPIAINYARRTILFQNFDQFRIVSTDLYIFLHLLMGKNNEAQVNLLAGDKSLLKRIKVNFNDIKRYLFNVWRDRDVPGLEWQILTKMERQLNITTANYRSMRRLSAKWNKLSHYEQQLVMTRLLMAFRIRARRSDLLPMLEKFAKIKRLELKTDLCNPETGEGCDDPDEASMKANTLLKKLAVGGLLAGGAALGVKHGLASSGKARNRK